MSEEFDKSAYPGTYKLAVIKHDGKNAFLYYGEQQNYIVNKLDASFVDGMLPVTECDRHKRAWSLTNTRDMTSYWDEPLELMKGDARIRMLPAEIFTAGAKIDMAQAKFPFHSNIEEAMLANFVSVQSLQKELNDNSSFEPAVAMLVQRSVDIPKAKIISKELKR